MSVVRISEPAEQDLAMSAEASEKVPSSPLIRLCRETFGTIAYKLIFYWELPFPEWIEAEAKLQR